MIRAAGGIAASSSSSSVRLLQLQHQQPHARRLLWTAATAMASGSSSKSTRRQGGQGAWCGAAAHAAPPACVLTVQMRGMAGHSKWAKIKRAKGANDRARAILFTKLVVELTEASRQAKGDTSDIRLAAAISKAKAANMPKDNIDGAIKRGAEGKAGANLEAVQYEGIGPGSTAIIVEALTDNRKRTAPNIRHIFSKNGGNLGTTGSVAWMFERRGLLEVELKRDQPDGAAGEKLLEDALEAGAEDVEEEEDEDEEAAAEPKVVARVYCEPAALAEVRKGLEERGWSPSLVQFSFVPKDWVDVQEEGGEGEGQALFGLLDALEEDPDVQNVFHNARLV